MVLFQLLKILWLLNLRIVEINNVPLKSMKFTPESCFIRILLSANLGLCAKACAYRYDL